ncbi:hypothetical protein HZ994_11355 [Akkermansiaceae bacterium]|nr:hypothetical protein HZ994_11355 [Akkermansiaceae bacterium]
MAERHSYEPVLSSKAADFLLSLSKARQKKLIGLLYQLAASPAQIGDYSEPDDTGRDVQFILIRDLLVAFWADHPVKELRIVDIEEV